jgi:DNA-binding HxlR family transcriptional regulator
MARRAKLHGMRETSQVDPFCPRYHHAVELIGRRWTGAVLRVLLSGRQRFHCIQEAIPGISDRLLIERLRELEAEGVVTRRVVAGPPLQVDYELTKKGRDLEPALLAVADWAERWIPGQAEARPA